MEGSDLKQDSKQGQESSPPFGPERIVHHAEATTESKQGKSRAKIHASAQTQRNMPIPIAMARPHASLSSTGADKRLHTESPSPRCVEVVVDVLLHPNVE